MSVRNEQNQSQPLTRAINVGDLVIGKERRPSYVIFRVLSISRNGWLRCQHVSDQNGRQIPNGFACHFRNSDMVPWGGPQ